MEDLFTLEPKLGGYERNGSEPSLRSLIFGYYREHCSFDDAVVYTNQYMDAVIKQSKE